MNAEGHVVGGGSSLAFKPEDIGRKNRAAAVAAGRAKAEAILAVCAHHPHKLLVVDEGADAADARTFAPVRNEICGVSAILCANL
ncbi:MAG: sugar-binding domain-containing protein [Christensenellales bacterium]